MSENIDIAKREDSQRGGNIDVNYTSCQRNIFFMKAEKLSRVKNILFATPKVRYWCGHSYDPDTHGQQLRAWHGEEESMFYRMYNAKKSIHRHKSHGH